MDIEAHTQPDSLERYAFWWLMALLVFSAAAMFMDARPALTLIVGYSAWSLLKLAWIVSGAAAVYLVYRWNQTGKKVFGGDDSKDKLAFWFMILTGLNVGLTGVTGNNIYLSIFYGSLVYVATGVACLAAAYHMHTRWKANGEKLFTAGSAAATVTTGTEGTKEDSMEEAEASDESATGEVDVKAQETHHGHDHNHDGHHHDHNHNHKDHEGHDHKH